MRYFIGLFALLLLLGSTLGSCSSSKTYAEMLAEEEDAIEDFIAERGLKIITAMPKDTLFANKEYIKFANGLYMHIIYRGNLKSRPKVDTTNLLIRFREYYNLLYMNDSSYVNTPENHEGNWYARAPQEFMYGRSDRMGWQYPLQFLGDSARVALIIPSKLGNSDEQSAVIPYYYGEFKYIFEK